MQSNEDVILEMVLCTGGASPLSLDVSGEARKDFSDWLARRQMGQAQTPENPIMEKEMDELIRLLVYKTICVFLAEQQVERITCSSQRCWN